MNQYWSVCHLNQYGEKHKKEALICLTSNTSFPDHIGVFEARNNVVGDSEGEFQAVFASFLQCEETLLRTSSKWNWQDQVWPSRA